MPPIVPSPVEASSSIGKEAEELTMGNPWTLADGTRISTARMTLPALPVDREVPTFWVNTSISPWREL
ncbi:hypothetical protein D3C72_2470730 [compost metagenome]